MPQQDILHHIIRQNGSEPWNVSILEKEALKYPYFGVLHYFLLKETVPGNSGYQQIAAKAALHFNDPFLLNYQLNSKRVSVPAPIREEPQITAAPAAAASQPTEEAPSEEIKKEELIFEPLYTTDYFASQGIRLSEEVQTGDKLGKQLKSFTEWLKTMKKVNGNKLPEVNDPVDVQVQRLAENSNKEEDVITESMAEVFHQQGKLKKAAEVYEKLSLLNPSKSAYFAAKLELLKEK